MTLEQLKVALSRVEEHVTIEMVGKYPMALSILTTEVVREQLVAMNWCLCDAPTGAFFVTSDTPLNVFSRKGNKALFGAGFALPNVEVAFPISPNLCAFASRAHQPRRRRCAASFVTEINRRAICMAERFVVAPYKTRQISSLVEEFKGTRVQPRVDRGRVAQRYRQQPGFERFRTDEGPHSV